MDKKAKVATPRLGQRADGSFLASWVVSAPGPSAANMNPTVMMPKTHCCHSDTRVPHWLVTRCTKAKQSHPCKSRISYDSSHGVYEPKATSCPWLPQREVLLDTTGQPPPAPGGVLGTPLSLLQKGQSSPCPVSVSAFTCPSHLKH